MQCCIWIKNQSIFIELIINEDLFLLAIWSEKIKRVLFSVLVIWKLLASNISQERAWGFSYQTSVFTILKKRSVLEIQLKKNFKKSSWTWTGLDLTSCSTCSPTTQSTWTSESCSSFRTCSSWACDTHGYWHCTPVLTAYSSMGHFHCSFPSDKNIGFATEFLTQVGTLLSQNSGVTLLPFLTKVTCFF